MTITTPPPGLPVDADLAAFIAGQAIDLFVETRDVHARDEDEAKRQAVQTVAEGASLDVKALGVDPANLPVTRSATVKATTLRWLLDGILEFAARDLRLPTLSAVRLRTREDGQLTATATDQYRAGIVRLPADSVTDRVGEIDALIPRAAVEALLNLLPEPEDRDEGDTSWLTEAAITQAGDRVDVKLTCSNRENYPEPSYGFLAVDGPPYPPIEGLIRRIADQAPNVTQPVAFTPRLLEGFGKLDVFSEGVRLWCGADPLDGVAVAIGSHFIGAVMPVRQQDKDRRMEPWPTYDPDVWAPILGDPAPPKEKQQ